MALTRRAAALVATLLVSFSMADCNLPTNYTIIDSPSDSDSISSCQVIDGSLSLLLDASPSSWSSDEAAVDLGDVTTIEGDLVIYAHEKPDKTTVTAERIAAVDGQLTIQVPDTSSTVDTLEISFPKLETVGSNYVITGGFKELVITHDAAMAVEGMVRVNAVAAEELDFPGVETVGQDFSIDGNGKLMQMRLGDLTTVEGSFLITDNGKLAGVSFPSLKTIERDVTIQGNGALEKFELTSLASAGTISFTGNADEAAVSLPRLAALGGKNGTSTSTFSGVKEIHLSSLAKVNGALAFQSTSLDDLTIPLLKMLNGSITVDDNPSLTTLALPRTSALGDVFIKDNDELSNITANALQTVGTVSIKGSALKNVEFFGLEEVTGDFKVSGADGMDCSWFDEHVKTITKGTYACKGDHEDKERKPSTGGIEDTEGNADDYIVTLSDDEGDEPTGESGGSDSSTPSETDSGDGTRDDSAGENGGGGGGGGLSTGAIAGIVVGVVVVLLLLAVFFWLRRRKRRQALPLPIQRGSKIIAVSEQSSVTHSSDGSPTEPSHPRNQNFFDAKVGVQTRISANIQLSSLPPAHRGGDAREGIRSSVIHSASESAYEVGFRVLNAIQSVKDNRKKLAD